MHLGWSSCVYPLEADDLGRVPDYAGDPVPDSSLPDDQVILFIRDGEVDSLLRGRSIVAANAGGTVMARIVFRPNIAKWNIPAAVVRVFRNHYRFRCSNVYHMSPQSIRDMGLERTVRSLDNPQPRANKDRHASMERLLNSLRTNGYDDARPIVVMLCRTGGRIDSLRQGHHRVSACLACEIGRMAVTFDAAGAVPWGRNKIGVESVRKPEGRL